MPRRSRSLFTWRKTSKLETRFDNTSVLNFFLILLYPVVFYSRYYNAHNLQNTIQYVAVKKLLLCWSAISWWLTSWPVTCVTFGNMSATKTVNEYVRFDNIIIIMFIWNALFQCSITMVSKATSHASYLCWQ